MYFARPVIAVRNPEGLASGKAPFLTFLSQVCPEGPDRKRESDAVAVHAKMRFCSN